MKNGPLVRTGRVFNDPYPADVVRLQIWDAEGESAADVSMTMDEAVHISAALIRTVSREMMGNLTRVVRRHYGAK
jgi:hypothetical protein